MKNKIRENEVQTARVEIIAPLIEFAKNFHADEDGPYPEFRDPKFRAIVKERSESFSVSRKTVLRYYKAYKENGMKGLLPKERAGQAKKLSEETERYAVSLRRAVPERSVNEVIYRMEQDGVVAPGTVKRSTLQDVFKRYRVTASDLRSEKEAKAFSARFEKSFRNELWMGDIMEGPSIRINGKSTRTYLSVFIDDYSRFVPHAEFYPNQKSEIVFDTLKKAVVEYGLPSAVYLDNGKQYKNPEMRHFCDLFGIKLIYCKPHSPASKGKVERLLGTAKRQLWPELKAEHMTSIEQMNLRLSEWLERYHARVHSATKEAPRARFMGDLMHPLRMPDEELLAFAFKKCVTRKANSAGEISYKRVSYFAGKENAGRRLSIYLMNDESKPHLLCDDGSLKPLAITRAGPFVKEQKTETGRKDERSEKGEPRRRQTIISYGEDEKDGE
ncbi:MAG: DDE-type integrase/transposase/recombinase [Bacteroidales bacterium]|nr:DDE-type integrase/transposase/recombinase [Bacteroidales bacterium]